MRPSAKIPLIVAALVIAWIVSYWLTEAPARDAREQFERQLQSEAQAVPAAAVPAPVARIDPEPTPLLWAARSNSANAPLVMGASTPALDGEPAGGGHKGEPSPSSPAPTIATLPGAPDAPSRQTAAANTAGSSRVPSVGGVVPPTFDLYTVAPGDTASTISQKKYGTPKYWRQVLKANPLVDFMKLKAGRQIKVPVDPANIQGIPEKAQTDESPTLDYIVNEGDTLSSIATNLYGKSALWQLIRDANPGVINREGTNIRPGMTIKVPPPPAGMDFKPTSQPGSQQTQAPTSAQ